MKCCSPRCFQSVCLIGCFKLCYMSSVLPLGEKPFFCPSNGCEKTFSTQYSLKSHMKGHEKGHTYNALPNNNVSEVGSTSLSVLGGYKLNLGEEIIWSAACS